MQAGSGNIILKSGSTVTAGIPVSDKTQVMIDGSKLIINPKADLDYRKIYSLNIGSGVLEHLGENSWIWRGLNSIDFTAASATDKTAPRLSSTFPKDFSKNIAVDSNITLQFNESVKAGGANFVLKSGGKIVTSIAVTDTSQVSISGSTSISNPKSDLSSAKAFRFSASNGIVEDLAGNDWLSGSSDLFQFTKSATSTPADRTQPKSPRLETQFPSPASDIVFSFNESIKIQNLSAIKLFRAESSYQKIGNDPGFTASINDRKLKLNPSTNLNKSVIYKVEFGSGFIRQYLD